MLSGFKFRQPITRSRAGLDGAAASPKLVKAAVVESCTYGSETSLTALPKDVILEYSVTSKPLTAAEIKKGLAQAQQLKITFVPYRFLGVRAYYYSFTQSGITIQGLSAFKGTKNYGAATYSKLTSKSQLASLVRLAENL